MTRYKISVDLGGSNIRAALFDGRKMLRFVKKPTLADEGKESVLRQLVSAIEEIKSNNKIEGIGIGSPGPLKNGVIKNPPNLPLRNFNLQKFLEKKFITRVVVERDANCAVLAELKFGVKKKNFILLTFGTGIGGGIAVNGELYKGVNGYGGEMGHMIIDDEKDFEYWASGKALKRYSQEKLNKQFYLKDIIEMEGKAMEIVKKEVKYIGIGIASLVNVFDPEVVVLAGGFREAGEKFLKLIRKEVYQRAILPKKTRIIWSKLKEPGLLGASLLVK